REARAIFRAALQAADPVAAVRRHLRLIGETLVAGGRQYPLRSFDRVWVVGAGKASAAMASAVEGLLGKRIAGGLVNVKYGHGARLRRIEVNECGHPLPDEQGVRGATRIAGIVEQAGRRDLILCLISGGASALLPLPAPPITLEEKQAVTQMLLRSGASIHEMNAVRKHLSAIKGGQLARLARPAKVISLLLSDVVGDQLDVIGSGPTAPDPSTFADARSVLEKYGLSKNVPASVRHRIAAGVRGSLPETPKAADPAFRRARNFIVGSNRLAIDAAEAKARQLGYEPVVLSTTMTGEAREVARVHAAIAREVAASGRPAKRPACLISGGETTVTLRGSGVGGRNQEFVLAAAVDLAGSPGMVVLSGGTDGTDGPTDAAGAIADGSTVAAAAAKGLDAQRFLDENDSYHFFEAAGGLLMTGPTRTNVMDVRLVLVV
ncbi:MAG TPA: glycerate kinase, partial [Bryobacteraceae bacterium]|nr:glycerate kinase [Bryobacteraceae bacterium]